MATRANAKNAATDTPETFDAATGQPWGVPVSSQQTELTAEERAELEEMSIVDRMRAIVATTGSADKVRLKLYRRNRSTSKLDWCRDYTTHEFEEGDLEAIRAEWGPGDYQIRVIDSKGIALRSEVTIASPGFALANPRAEVNTQSSELASILTSMQETQNQLLRALAERPDPMAGMQQTLSMMTLFREAMGLTPGANPVQSASPMSQLKELLEVSREVRGAAKELAGDEPEKPDASDPMAMLGQLLPVITAALQQPKQNPAQTLTPFPPLQLPQSIAEQNAPAIQSAGFPAGVAHPEPLPEQSAQSETVEQMIMRGHIETLCEMAEKNEPHEKGAEYIADNVPDEMLVFMSNKYWFEIVARGFPIVKPYEQWLRTAKALADKLLEEDTEDDAPGPGHPGQ